MNRVRRLGQQDLAAIAELFAFINNDESATHFRPHPFDDEQALKIAFYDGDDLYMGLWVDSRLCGYGLLRGWDEGHRVPSLGIYVRPEVRGTGVSAEFMVAMHAKAKSCGANKIRLMVSPNNVRAKKLYE